MHEVATFNKRILPLHVELDVNNLICLWFVFQISSALPWSAAISVDRLRHDCQSHFNHSAASVTLHSDEGSWRPLKTMFPRSSLCPYNIFFWLLFSSNKSFSFSLPLHSFKSCFITRHSFPASQFPNQTHPSGGGLSFSVSVTSGEGKANLMTPHKQWLLGPNRCRHYPSSLSHSSLISHSVIIFVLVCRCLTHPAQRNSASGLHLFAQLFLFFFFLFLSLSSTHTIMYRDSFFTLMFCAFWSFGYKVSSVLLFLFNSFMLCKFLLQIFGTVKLHHCFSILKGFAFLLFLLDSYLFIFSWFFADVFMLLSISFVTTSLWRVCSATLGTTGHKSESWVRRW